MIELRRAFIVAAALTLLVLGLLTACDIAVSPAASPSPLAAASPSTAASATGTNTNPTASDAPTPSPGVPQGGAVTMRITSDVADLKPWDLRSRGEEYAANLMYSGLVRLSPTLRPEPDLAQSWEIAPNGGLITFTLRSDVRWHDGEPLTADDVLWTLNTLRTITPTNSLLFDLRSTIGQVQTPLTNTVVISLTQPYAPILSELAVPILPKHRLQTRSPEQIATLNFWNEPVGSGPFKFDRREPDQGMTFVRNEAFYRGAPNLDQVALVVAPEADVAENALRQEQLLIAEFPDAVRPLSDTQDFVQGAYPENGWYGVVFNVRPDRLFADQRLREALARAVDVPALVEAVTNGAGQPIATTLSSASYAFPADIAVSEQDFNVAQQLLDDAGWVQEADGIRRKNGQPLAAKLWARGDDPQRVAAAERIAEAGRALGMQIEVTAANFDTVILAKLAPPYDFDLLLGSWVNAPNSAGFPTNSFYDPDDYPLFHSSRVWRGQGDPRTALRNVGGFANTEYDAAAEEARRTYDPAARAQAIQRAQSVLQRERPYLLLWTNRIPVVINARVRSAEGSLPADTPRYLWNVEQWYLEQ